MLVAARIKLVRINLEHRVAPKVGEQLGIVGSGEKIQQRNGVLVKPIGRKDVSRE